MAVLVFLFLALLPFQAQASPEKKSPVEIIIDPGNPDASVGVVGENVLELGSLYENYSVVGFEPSAIVLKRSESTEYLKSYPQGKVSEKVHGRARRLFVVKQMKAIYEAQVKFLEKFRDHFSPDINKLIDHGFLPNGFQDMTKQNYSFRILTAGHAKLLAVQFEREPTFLAVAEPLDPEADPWYFSVDQLGQIRYARSLRSVSWGPVWDYGGLNEVLPSTVIEHTVDKEGAEEN